MSSRSVLAAALFLSAVLPAGALVGPAAAQEMPPPLYARLFNAQGEPAGAVSILDDPLGMRLVVNITNLPPGAHGFHIHAAGNCKPSFEAAGPHLNPAGARHGFKADGGPHAGDLPNLYVPSNGKIMTEFVTNRIPAGVINLLGAGGSSIVVHADPDDYTTDPAGMSGTRIACGVIERGFYEDARDPTGADPTATPPKP